MSLKLGGLGIHNAEQLTHSERPRRSIHACGEAGGGFTVFAVFQNSTGTFTLQPATVFLRGTKCLNSCPLLVGGVDNLGNHDKKFTAFGC